MRVKNLSRCNSRLRKSLKESPNRTKVGNRHSWSADQHMASVDRHFPSAYWHSFEARPRNILMKIKHIHFDFLEIRIWPNSHLIQSSLYFKWGTKIRNQDPFFKLLFPLTLKKLWKFCFRNFFSVKRLYLNP